MTAEATSKPKIYRAQIRSEWNSLKEHDVLFLLCIASSMITSAEATQLSELSETHKVYPFFLLLLLLFLACFFLGLKWIRGTDRSEETTAGSAPASVSEVDVSTSGSPAASTDSESEYVTPSGSPALDTTIPSTIVFADKSNSNVYQDCQLIGSNISVKGKKRFGDVLDGYFDRRLVSIRQDDVSDDATGRFALKLSNNKIKHML